MKPSRRNGAGIWRFVAVLIVLVIVMLQCLFLYLCVPSSTVQNVKDLVYSNVDKKPNRDYPIAQNNVDNIRVAMLIVYQGKSLPIWMETLALTMHLSGSLVDWIIIVTERHMYTSTQNIKFVYINEDDLCHRLTMLDSSLNGEINMIKTLFKVWPYAFVEFKPCLGTLFADYLDGYSHWGYADVDQLFGKFDYLISKQLLSEYDVYTASFGDNFRLYMRGQFAIYRNNDVVNNIWRQCAPYTQLADRLKFFVNSGAKHWYFESAEGCISQAVVTTPGLKLYSASSQISDAIDGTPYDIESILLSDTVLRCYQHPLPPVQQAGFISQLSTPTHYEKSYKDIVTDSSLDTNTNTNTLPRLNAQRLNYNCEYWVNPDYQVCLNSIPATADTVLSDGALTYNQGDLYVFDHLL